MEGQPLQLRAHGVHHKARHRRQHAGAWHGAGQGQQADQFVRAIAQQQSAARGQGHMTGQRRAQVVYPGAGVAVDGQSTQPLTQLGLQGER